ncbi:ketoacyl-ACP synthase III [Methylomonas sp. HYX-M1]|uniref:ketoacyl-ACP synthase III n=1 Tax=Methylomonas sp. HYX-M1 TaxID=3139307 RepID=UPI00345BD11A
MIGIQAIGTYIPVQRIDNRERLSQFAVDESFLHDKIGMLRLAVKAADEETSDLCCKAFADLQRKVLFDSDEIQCIVVCTQNPDGRGLPHTSANVHGKLGLSDSCAAFDISLGCSGFVYGLSVIQAFMQANGFEKGILFTADPYSKIIDAQDKNTSLLFGDGATATLIGGRPLWQSGRFVFGSRGCESSAIQVEENGKLAMNGRGVFSFSATEVPSSIRRALSDNNLTENDVDCYLLHQGSRYIVDTIAKKLGVAPDKVPFGAADYGNTVSSSIPLLLNESAADHRIVVVAGFGVGLSWASTVLFKTEIGAD